MDFEGTWIFVKDRGGGAGGIAYSSKLICFKS